MPTASKAVRANENTPDAALGYYQGLARMTPAELGRERMVLVAVPQTPYTQVRLAMLLGHPRVQQDLGKGLALRSDMLRAPYIVQQNQTVTLVAEGNGFRVSNVALVDGCALAKRAEQDCRRGG